MTTLHHGDCLDIMQTIADESIDMILCDLPYSITSCKWDIIIPFNELWAQYNRIIKPNGAIVLTAAQPFTSLLITSNLKMFRYEWIWEKQQGTGFLNAKKQPLRNHESVLVFYKKQPVYNPQFTESGKKLTGSRKSKPVDLADYAYRQYESTEYKDNGLRYPKSVLSGFFDTERFNTTTVNRKFRHPTQKPVSLMEYLIKTYTNENDWVLDNCMGSGTTGIACANTNRRFIGIEQNNHYFQMSKERIEAAEARLKLFY